MDSDPTNPAIVNGQIVSGAPKLANRVTIQIGGVSGIVPAFAGLTFAGEYQIDVTIPTSTPSGNIALNGDDGRHLFTPARADHSEVAVSPVRGGTGSS